MIVSILLISFGSTASLQSETTDEEEVNSS